MPSGEFYEAFDTFDKLWYGECSMETVSEALQSMPIQAKPLDCCPCCLNQHIRRLGRDYRTDAYDDLPSYQGTFEKRHYETCGNCGFFFGFPFVETATLSNFYSRVYRSSPEKDPIRNKYTVSSRGLAQAVLLRQFAPKASGFSVLDVGAGFGLSLNSLRHVFVGSEIALHALEPDSYTQDRLRKLGCETHPFAFGPGVSEALKCEFDFVILSHVLEHFNACDLRLVTREISQLVKPEGLVLIEVPHDAVGDHVTKFCHVPHLSFFNIESLRKLLLGSHFEILFAGRCGKNVDDVYPPQHPGLVQSSVLDRVKRLPRGLIRRAKERFSPPPPKNPTQPILDFIYHDKGSVLRVLCRRVTV